MEDLADDLMEAEMMIRRTWMRMEVVVKTKGKIIKIISMTKIIEIKEEDEEGKDLEEEVFVENVFTMEKCIEHLSVPNTKEGLILEMNTQSKYHMLMKMLNHHIQKMLKEAISYLTKESS